MRFLPLVLALIFAFLTPGPVQAMSVETVDGPEGVEVWLVEEHSLPMIAVSISLTAGSAYDPADRPGLASMMVSLLNEGAGDLDDAAFKEALEERAIRMGFGAGRDYLVISLSTLTENADQAFRLLALALSQPRFDPEPVERTRVQILASLRQDEESPGTIAAKAWSKGYFGTHPYAHPGDGTPEGVAAITIEDIRNFAASYLVRGGAKVVAAGDITAVQLSAYLDQALGSLPARAVSPVQPVTAWGEPGTEIIAMDVPQPAVVFGMPGPMRHDPDFIPTYIANYIFGGGGFSSRLMEEVRDRRGLTYGISTRLNNRRASAIIRGSVQSERSRVTTAIEVMKDEMERFARDGATVDELADAKTYLTGSFPLSFDSNTKLASNLNGFQRAGLDVDYVVRRNDLIEAVTLEDVDAMARKYYVPERLYLVIAGTPTPPEGAPETP